jgi:hypothetical protein
MSACPCAQRRLSHALKFPIVGIQLDPLDSAIPHPVYHLLLSLAAAAAQPELLIAAHSELPFSSSL